MFQTCKTSDRRFPKLYFLVETVLFSGQWVLLTISDANRLWNTAGANNFLEGGRWLKCRQKLTKLLVDRQKESLHTFSVLATVLGKYWTLVWNADLETVWKREVNHYTSFALGLIGNHESSPLSLDEYLSYMTDIKTDTIFISEPGMLSSPSQHCLLRIHSGILNDLSDAQASCRNLIRAVTMRGI